MCNCLKHYVQNALEMYLKHSKIHYLRELSITIGALLSITDGRSAIGRWCRIRIAIQWADSEYLETQVQAFAASERSRGCVAIHASQDWSSSMHDCYNSPS